MIDTLTKLQRLGISYLLSEFANKSTFDLKRGGTIRFMTNYLGQFTNMFVRIKNDKYPVIESTFDMKEEINDRVEYEFDYDPKINMFRIYEKGEES